MYTKHCLSCNRDLDLSLFSKRRGKNLQSKCKECQRKYAKEHYNKNKEIYLKRNKANSKKCIEWYKKYKSKLKCEKCGENHPSCLHFHHTDPNNKEKNISELTTYGLKKLKEEIEKCVILCANCHAKLHYDLKMNTGQ